MYKNVMKLNFSAISENESFARVAVAAFVGRLNPTLAEVMEIKTAVSEAVTNAIIHGYEGMTGDLMVELSCRINGNEVFVEIADTGRGIADIEKAREPMYTSKPEMERSGMGFTVMEEFMDEIEIVSQDGKGTTIRLKKVIK